jgi:hypothetical protein
MSQKNFLTDFEHLKPPERLGADHAPIGDHTKVADTKALANPLHHRQQRCDIGGVPRPHLAANGADVAIEHGPDNHLEKILAVVFAKSPAAKMGATAALNF